jgi:hypothetical protein
MQRDDAACVSQANAKGMSVMFRKLLLPMLAAAMLAGCATDYRYRGGNGDYYYGSPRVEYRYQGIGGYYNGFGLDYGYGGSYYDPFGRLIYGYPGGYYGGSYYGGNGWYRPRPRRDHGDRDDHDGHDHNDGDGNHHDRPPPWRDLGGLQHRDQDVNGFRNRDDRQQPMRSPRPMSSSPAPIRPQRADPGAPPSAPRLRERSDSSSRHGSSDGNAWRSRGGNR